MSDYPNENAELRAAIIAKARERLKTALGSRIAFVNPSIDYRIDGSLVIELNLGDLTLDELNAVAAAFGTKKVEVWAGAENVGAAYGLINYAGKLAVYVGPDWK